MLNPMQSLDLIQAIRTMRTWTKWFNEQSARALGCISVNDAGTEVNGFWTKENLALMMQSITLIEQNAPIFREKAQRMIDEVKRIEEEVRCGHQTTGV